jgi:hypothetical protein
MGKRSAKAALETEPAKKAAKTYLEASNSKLRKAIGDASDEFVCPITVGAGVGFSG